MCKFPSDMASCSNVFLEFDAPTATLNKISDMFNQDRDVIRYNVVKLKSITQPVRVGCKDIPARLQARARPLFRLVPPCPRLPLFLPLAHPHGWPPPPRP